MTDVQEQLVHDWSESLRQASANPIRDTPEATILARAVAAFIDLLSTVWQVIVSRSQRGGTPAPTLLRECDLLLTMAIVPDEALQHLGRYCDEQERAAGGPLSIRPEVIRARQELENVVQAAQKLRKLAATPPRVSPSLADLQQRLQQADERGEWVPLKDAIARTGRDAAPEGG